MNRLLLIVILFCSCSGKNNIPSDLLPKEEMEVVLWDMIRADQFLLNYVFVKDTAANKREESIKLYRKVLQLHKISKTKFEKSLAYYKARPQLLQPILDSLSKAYPPVPKENKTDSSVNPGIADSIKKLKRPVQSVTVE